MTFIKRIPIILIFMLNFFPAFVVAQEKAASEFESFALMIEFDQIGRKSFTALFDSQTEKIYLPIPDLFDYLKIYHQKSSEGKEITGYLNHEINTFSIFYDKHEINFNNQQFQIQKEDMVIDLGTIYLSGVILEKIFGFKISFDFRTLSAKLKADFEFPLVRHLKLENARAKLKKLNGIFNYDDSIPRNYKWFEFGMLDWSLNAMQGLLNENRVGLGVGAEVLGGEASVWLNYSDVYGFNLNQQRYYWRWVDNHSRFIKQIQVGRIYNRTISSLLHPVDGITVTNAPSTIRKALGTYPITDYTEPDWLVELYINNILVDYTNADASGIYQFEVPVVYGTTRIMLRFYGPNGEERSEEKIFNMPYNFLPAGEFEYRVTGGYVLNSARSAFGRAEASYGISRGITVGAGTEYSGTIVGNSRYIPFITASIQPFTQLIFSGEYAHNVRSKFMLNYTLPGNSIIELNHTRYDKDQTAIIFNYLQESYARISVPFVSKKGSGFIKGGFRQLKYNNFAFNSGELIGSGYLGKVNLNLANYISWSQVSIPYIYSQLSLGYRLPRNLNLRSSVQYNFSNNRFISYKAEMEKQLFRRGLLSVGYENNIQSAYSSVNVSLKYDFSFMTAYSSTSFTNKRIISSQNARGSLSFGSGNKYVHADNQNAVGRCGFSVIPFVDVNHNGKRDDDEPLADNLNVRCNGGQMITREKDHILRMNGLEPFVEYSLILDELGFDNLSWQIKEKNIQITTDPNQFKKIQIPVTPMGEVYGNVVDESDDGIGRIIVNIFNENDIIIARTQTESDGFFSYLGLSPGKYNLAVDSIQLSILKMTSTGVHFSIEPSFEGDMVDAGKLIIKKVPVPVNLEINRKILRTDSLFTDSLKIKSLFTDSISADSIVKVREKMKKSFDSPVLFDFDKSEIRSDNESFLNELVELLKQYPCLTLKIEAHTCPIGSAEYNQRLSERRGRSVKNFLIKRGIDPNRLVYVGYGESKPANNNRTNAEKALNRRATFTNTSGIDCAPDFELIFNAK